MLLETLVNGMIVDCVVGNCSSVNLEPPWVYSPYFRATRSDSSQVIQIWIVLRVSFVVLYVSITGKQFIVNRACRLNGASDRIKRRSWKATYFGEANCLWTLVWPRWETHSITWSATSSTYLASTGGCSNINFRGSGLQCWHHSCKEELSRKLSHSYLILNRNAYWSQQGHINMVDSDHIFVSREKPGAAGWERRGYDCHICIITIYKGRRCTWWDFLHRLSGADLVYVCLRDQCVLQIALILSRITSTWLCSCSESHNHKKLYQNGYREWKRGYKIENALAFIYIEVTQKE